MDWTRLQRAEQVYRQEGGKELLARLSGYGILPPGLLTFKAYRLYVLDSPTRVVKRIPSGIEFGFARHHEAPVLAALETEGTPEQVKRGAIFEHFFTEGAQCIVARHRGVIVAQEWFFRDRYPLTTDDFGPGTIEVTLGDGIFLSNLFVAPAFRLRGLVPHLFRFVLETLPPQTPLYAHIERTNHRSIKAHERFGFREIAELEYWRFLSLPHRWVLRPKGSALREFSPRRRINLSRLPQPLP